MADTNNFATPTPDEGFDRHEPKSGMIALVSGATVLFLIGMIVFVYWFYTVAYESVEYSQYSGKASQELQAIHDREEEHLHRYSYIDKEKGLVRIPIDRAIDLMVTEFQQDGKVFYNTTAYPAKPEPPGGAAGEILNPPAGSPLASAAQPAAPASTNANATASH